MKIRNLFALVVITNGFTSCQQPATQNDALWDTGVSQELANFREKNLKDIRYQLYFDIPENKEEALKGQAEITCTANNPNALILDFKVPENQIDSVCLNGHRVDYRFYNEHIQVKPRLGQGKNTIAVYFTCSDQSLNRRENFLYTLLVPDRARTLFPCFDQPNLKALYKLCLEIPSGWQAVANGKVLSEEELQATGRRLIKYQETEPISTYLFSFVTGELNKASFTRDSRELNIFHRENDTFKSDQCSDIANEVFDALDWMEKYTAIPYPFAKYDLIVVPGFQFGGMEHVGATLYTDSRMFLNKQATLREHLMRSSLIAHETAHMWFGDYVTMKWFDDVWTKEVFANYFASLITEPRYQGVNHRLNFMLDYLPGAYNEDRTAGSNAIKQNLDNLERAGLVYGNIIYNKSPWVMSSLSDRMGKEKFQKGMQLYLKKYANANATWDDLIAVLDELTDEDLKTWSHSWVNEKGRPTIQAKIQGNELVVSQIDEWQRGVTWPQKLTYLVSNGNQEERVTVNFVGKETEVKTLLSFSKENSKKDLLNNSQDKSNNKVDRYLILPNVDGKGYGLFSIDDVQQTATWKYLQSHQDIDADTEVLRGALLINLYENLRHGNLSATVFQQNLIDYIAKEKNQLLFTLALGYLSNCQNWYPVDRTSTEDALWQLATTHPQTGARLQAFRYYRNLAQSPKAVDRLYKIWQTEDTPGNCHLSEKDFMQLAYTLALHIPSKAKEIVAKQAKRITHPDRRREFAFVAAATSPIESERDSVFACLLKQENRSVEPWASAALALLNHPVYGKQAVKYIRPALDKMEEIQRTGDIFFPRAWANALLKGHTSHEAAEEVRKFFADHPDYPIMLGNKIKQQAEHLEKR